jgi:hypothetical protein
MKPKIKRISMQIESTEGTTCCSWEPGKRFAKATIQPEDPVKWFKHRLAQCKEHRDEPGWG